MSMVIKPLFNAKYASDSGNTEYTVPVGKAVIIDKFTATNTDSGAVTISVNLVPYGASNGSSNLVVKALSVAAGATDDITELQNQVLAAGDFIYVTASVASKMVIRASGREVS